MYDDIDIRPLGFNEQPWIKEIRAAAGLSDSLDREGGAIVLEKLLGRPVSPETLRRWAIPYKVIAGCARYEVSDIVAYAKAQIENAPRRIGRRSSPQSSPKVTGNVTASVATVAMKVVGVSAPNQPHPGRRDGTAQSRLPATGNPNPNQERGSQ